MKIIQSPTFIRKVKKFHKKEKEELDKIIRLILKNPTIGQGKKGDLKDVFIYKFKIKNIQYLIAYRIKNGCIELIMIGTHENYYRDLKTFLKSKY
jgi:mRNA-degrading endonuclease RelE of RelBE toxin-antitoxin system